MYIHTYIQIRILEIEFSGLVSDHIQISTVDWVLYVLMHSNWQAEKSLIQPVKTRILPELQNDLLRLYLSTQIDLDFKATPLNSTSPQYTKCTHLKRGDTALQNFPLPALCYKRSFSLSLGGQWNSPVHITRTCYLWDGQHTEKQSITLSTRRTGCHHLSL